VRTVARDCTSPPSGVKGSQQAGGFGAIAAVPDGPGWVKASIQPGREAFPKWNPPRPPAASTPPLEGIF
jgi:hypothetical protein